MIGRRNSGLRRVLLLGLAVVLGPTTAWAGGRIDGVWEGTYSCAQGDTGLSLFVSGQAGGRLRTVFFFYPTPDNPMVPTGCFEMSGTYDAATGDAEFVAGQWLLRPPGYVTVDLAGAVDARVTRMSGDVDGPGCDTFSLRHVAAASRPVPAVCRPAPDVVASNGG